MKETTWEDFQKIDLRIGTILEVIDFPEARKPAYRLSVDFGKDIGIKKSSAQLTDLYTKESLVGKRVIAVINFPKKQIGPIQSECLVVGFHRDDGVILAIPDGAIPNGARLV
ncbi:tRNA-binding protein [Piscirickettsia litoralis]|uniref:tRNA-binding protein n=1 Tax=Piscirickettsia litoralis TaxID=1891921 RepID=A0ABX3A3U0_9GAMM|nr:tRNA-binding protein [Piscirickettsia litoralis]ODN42100.1 tRNA-binding protein [Piscirickettsia litoralis]